MSPSPVWTITASEITPPGPPGDKLVGCHIVLNATQSAYELTKPNINDVLAISSGTTLPVTFPAFNYKGYHWVVTLVTASIGAGVTVTWVIAEGVEEGEAASSAHN